MRPDVVVVVSPDRQLSAGIGQAVEYLLIEAFVAQAAVEALDEAILLRLFLNSSAPSQVRRTLHHSEGSSGWQVTFWAKFSEVMH